ncbi:hypothetical protein [Rheinheimera gaetbuli]
MALSENEFVAIVGVVGTLSGVVIGWGLTSLTEWIRNKYKFDAKKASILLELEDLYDALQNADNAVVQEFEMYARNEYAALVKRPANLALPITNEYFKEISHVITKNERINLRNVLYNIDYYNINLDYFLSARKEKRPAIEHVNIRAMLLLYIRALLAIIYLIKKHGLNHQIRLNEGNLQQVKDDIDRYKNELYEIKTMPDIV